ncbi:MAG: UDP-N-acetylmuramoyl-L-alanine--D-glutamate ligase [Gammaproteobacteria bacterium]|nr:UDP-N-acetylmuramoyl-L-alanine--D-glutamate ligase [Gammaproteobacteria bacterium]
MIAKRPLTNLVLGLGRTGYSAARHLRAQGETVVVADSRAQPPFLARLRRRYPQIEVITGRLPAERYPEFDRIVVSPGLAPPAADAAPRRAGCAAPAVVGDIELFAQCLRESAGAPVIAITGSNGKSTVTTMGAALLEAAGRRCLSGGNLGPPALELLEAPRPDFYVLELSSFQLETTRRLRLAAAAILNLSADHFDRHPDMPSYAAAKARILRGAPAGACVLNRDDPALAELRAKHPEAVTFGLNPPPGARDFGVVDTADGRFLCHGEARLVAANALSAPGAHNLANALAALALAQCAGVEIAPAALDALRAYRGLEHRCEVVADIDGVKWVNDSKATNVGATVAAIAGLCAGAPAAAGETPAAAPGAPTAAGGLLLIAGGLGKGADFALLRAPVGRHVSCVALFGEDAPRLAAALDGCARIIRAADLRAAVAAVARAAQPGQTALFSPACASFDQFDDYQARGRAFKKLVAALADRPAGKATVTVAKTPAAKTPAATTEATPAAAKTPATEAATPAAAAPEPAS